MKTKGNSIRQWLFVALQPKVSLSKPCQGPDLQPKEGGGGVCVCVAIACIYELKPLTNPTVHNRQVSLASAALLKCAVDAVSVYARVAHRVAEQPGIHSLLPRTGTRS